jgi:anti-sigma B factor antagonist
MPWPVRRSRSVDVQPQRETVEIIPAGELDLATVGHLQSELEKMIEVGFDRIVIDLRPVEFLDSTGLHALLSAQARAEREGWQLAVIPGQRAVQRIFEVTGAIDRLPFIAANGGVSNREVSDLGSRPPTV